MSTDGTQVDTGAQKEQEPNEAEEEDDIPWWSGGEEADDDPPDQYVKQISFPEDDWKPKDRSDFHKKGSEMTCMWSVKLPSTIFGLAPAMTMAAPTRSNWKWMKYSLPYWILLYIVVIIQAYFLFCIQQHVNEDDECKEPTGEYLRQAVVFIFTATVWEHMWKCVKLASYFLMMPVVGKWNRANKFIINPYTGEPDTYETGELGAKKAGITRTFLLAVHILVILPQFLLGCGFWYCGCLFLLHSDGNDEIIMNTTGLVFVLEIGDYCFDSMCPDAAKEQVELYPKLSVSPADFKNNIRKNKHVCAMKFIAFLTRYGSIVFVALIGISSSIILHQLEDALTCDDEKDFFSL